jgi:hypothetical protein
VLRQDDSCGGIGGMSRPRIAGLLVPRPLLVRRLRYSEPGFVCGMEGGVLV